MSCILPEVDLKSNTTGVSEDGDIMLETWIIEDRGGLKDDHLVFPRRRPAPVLDILQWLQCVAAVVGVLLSIDSTMVPDCYYKCANDFYGPM